MFFASLAHAMGAAPQGAEGQGNPIAAFAPLIIMFLIFYFLLIRPQQKKAKQHKELLSNLKRGDWIMTNGGLYGRISAVDGDVLSVDLGNDMVVKVGRNFVAGLSEPQREERKKGKKDKEQPQEKKSEAKADTSDADDEADKNSEQS